MQVEIIFPKHTFDPVLYRFLHPVQICNYNIPAGFVTDGASVPRIFWNIFPPVGRYFVAAALHDYLLSQGISLMKANKQFLNALKEQKVSRFVSYTMYSAVVAYKGYLEAKRFVKDVWETLCDKSRDLYCLIKKKFM